MGDHDVGGKLGGELLARDARPGLYRQAVGRVEPVCQATSTPSGSARKVASSSRLKP